MIEVEKDKVFLSNKYLMITSNHVSYSSLELDKRIYIKDVAGTSFYHARLERVMAIITFAVGFFGLVLYKPYPSIYLLIGASLFVIGGVVAFFLSKDTLTINSTSSSLSISYKLDLKENSNYIQDALDDAIKYSRKK